MVAYAFVATEEEDTHEPLTYQEAVACEDSSKWKAAMKEQMDYFRKNKTRELVDHLVRQKLVSCKCLFKIKEGIDVVQKPSLTHIYSGYTCIDCILDVKMAFLHGNFEEVIYMRQPLGYEQGNKIACKSKAEIRSAKSLLKKEFDMKELEKAKNILGMEIVRDRSHKILRVSQSGDSDVERMGKVLYANAVRSLMYLMVFTRPYIAYAGTVNIGLVYGTNHGNHVDLTGFIDSDYAKDPDKGRSIIGYVFLAHRCVVSWKATLQHMVALSTIEAEYMAFTKAVKEAIWLKGLLEELTVELNTVVLEAKTVKVLKVGTEHNMADALTKVVPGLKLQHCLELLNVGVG
ncbi:hypothetical protein Tco_1522831 [Tanacetum coccineum]